MDARNFPASWTSTGNSLEGLAFAAKDVLLTIDDFCPAGSQSDVARYHANAERIFRAQGNVAGRGRMRADGTLKAPKPPRGLVLATGEDVPRGHSMRSRMLIVELRPGDVDKVKLTLSQRHADAGLNAACMAGFLRYVAPKKDAAAAKIKADVAQARAAGFGADSAIHARTPDIAASLQAAFEIHMRFALETVALSGEEAGALRERCRKALSDSCARQAEFQQYLDLLSSVLASGRAHVASHPDGGKPTNFEAMGWRAEAHGEETCFRPQGRCVGTVDENAFFLDPDAAFAEVQALAGAQGEALAISGKTLSKRLAEKGLLMETLADRLLVYKTIAGVKRRVLVLRRDAILPA